MGFVNKLLGIENRRKPKEEKSEKEKFAEANKDLFEGANLAKLTLQEMEEMVRLKKEIETLTPSQMKALETQIKELSKKQGKKIKFLDDFLEKYIGETMVGIGTIAAIFNLPGFAAMGFLTGGPILISKAIEIIKKSKEERIRQKNLKAGYLHIRQKYGEDIAQTLLSGYEKIDDPSYMLSRAKAIIPEIAAKLNPDLKGKSIHEPKYSNDPAYLEALRAYADFEELIGNNLHFGGVEDEVKRARKGLAEEKGGKEDVRSGEEDKEKEG